MQAKALVVIATMLSFSALAEVSFKEKLQRVEALESLPSENLVVDSYRRELSYEMKGLSFESRAKAETNLLASKMRAQIAKAYEASLAENNNSTLALEEVKKAILQDLELAAPELKSELTEFSLSALEDASRGGSTNAVDLLKTEEFFMEASKDRSDYLNKDSSAAHPTDSSTRPTRLVHESKADFLSELTSDGDGTFVRGGNIDVRSEEYTSYGGEVAVQVRLEFLGGRFEAGPIINFRKDYNTTAIIVAEGYTPFLLADGNFDLWKRDAQGKVIRIDGKDLRRNTALSCQVDLRFTSTYSMSGVLKLGAPVGPGASVSSKATKGFSHSVSLTSRRVLLPDYVGKESVTMKFLADFCHHSFANARLSNKSTVKQNLDVMMKNVARTLVFSHPETKCATDNHCAQWFNQDVIAMVKINNVPRCVESKREKFKACVLRGKQGQSCQVIENGKLISDGSFEYTCDTGLKCVKTKEAGWFKSLEIFQYAKGSCQPINPKTYKAPSKAINVRFVK